MAGIAKLWRTVSDNYSAEGNNPFDTGGNFGSGIQRLAKTSVSPSRAGSLVVSPSFNDFSMHVHQDVEPTFSADSADEPQGLFRGSRSRSLDHQNSLSSQASVESGQEKVVKTGLPEKAKPMDVPQGRTSLYNHQSASITVMSEADRRAADRRAYMEWHELVRGSSL